MKILVVFLSIFLLSTIPLYAGTIDLINLIPYITHTFQDAIIDTQFMNEHIVAISSADTLYILDLDKKKIINEIVLDKNEFSLNFINFLASIDPFIILRMRSSIIAVDRITNKKIILLEDAQTKLTEWHICTDCVHNKILLANVIWQTGIIYCIIFDSLGNIENHEYQFKAVDQNSIVTSHYLHLCALHYPCAAFLMHSREFYVADITQKTPPLTVELPSHESQKIMFDPMNPTLIYDFLNDSITIIDIQYEKKSRKIELQQTNKPINNHLLSTCGNLIAINAVPATEKDLPRQLFISSLNEKPELATIVNIPTYDSTNFLISAFDLSPDFYSLAIIGYTREGMAGIKLFYLHDFILNTLTKKQNIVSFLQKNEYGKK